MISEHLEICPECKKEFTILSQQDSFIKQIETIEPSFNFRNLFWQKVQSSMSDIQRVTDYGLRVTRWWVPVPVVCSIVIFLFLIFSILAPVVHSQDVEMNKRVFRFVTKTVIGFSQHSVFSCINFINFCDEYCQVLCKYYCQKTGSKCICGRCKE